MLGSGHQPRVEPRRDGCNWNFEPTMLYKICNKNGGKCLGVVGGGHGQRSNVEQRAYTSW